ncbi:MAG: GNAT family N-acetyltransferase, partial [Propionibacteriaceae bacterium]
MSVSATAQHGDLSRPGDSRRPFPDCVPVLVDPAATVVLRAHDEADLRAIVEQARDAESQHWTTVPNPPGGYSLADARDFALNLMPAGWAAGTPLGWAIEAERDGERGFCGSIDLRLAGDGTAEVGFGLHPAARGRSLMSTALRLVRDYGFDELGLRALRWRARVGNWGSRRVAAAAGFTFEGTVRRLLSHRGVLLDGWLATMTAEDPRRPRPWMDSPVLVGSAVRLRPFTEADVPGIVEACSDPRTHHWLVSLPEPYGESDAREFIEATREMAAQCHGFNWCVADITTDELVGCISLDGFGGYSRRTEIGYWTHPAQRGRGRITEAVKTVTAFAGSRNITDSILSRCAAPNLASRHAAEAAGFTQI